MTPFGPPVFEDQLQRFREENPHFRNDGRGPQRSNPCLIEQIARQNPRRWCPLYSCPACSHERDTLQELLDHEEAWYIVDAEGKKYTTRTAHPYMSTDRAARTAHAMLQRLLEATDGRVAAHIGPAEADWYLSLGTVPVILANAGAPGPSNWLRITGEENLEELAHKHEIHIGRLNNRRGVNERHAMYKRVMKAAASGGTHHALPPGPDGSSRTVVDMNADAAATLSLPSAWTGILLTHHADGQTIGQTLTDTETTELKAEIGRNTPTGTAES